MSVRAAEPNDFAEMAVKGRVFWEQTEYSPHVPYSEESIIRWLEMMSEQGLLFLAEADGEIVGFIGGVAAPMYANDAYLAGAELFWYLDPRYRKGGTALDLLSAIEDAARGIGCTWWTMIALEAVEPERAASIYERSGYKPMERSFTKRL